MASGRRLTMAKRSALLTDHGTFPSRPQLHERCGGANERGERHALLPLRYRSQGRGRSAATHTNKLSSARIKMTHPNVTQKKPRSAAVIGLALQRWRQNQKPPHTSAVNGTAKVR
jgi:hypothetical protein